MKPREYQQDAIDATWLHVRHKKTNPCIEAPTGAGKSIIIGKLVADVIGWGGRACVLQHRKELIEQNHEKIVAMSPDADVGVYSAGLKRSDLDNQVIVAGIQSVHKKAWDFNSFDIVIVDEAHLIPPEGEGMFRGFLADCQDANPNVRIIGLTATPYRLKTGLVCGPENFLHEICYTIDVKSLIADGYLSPLISKHAVSQADLSSVGVRGGEFIPAQVQNEMIDGPRLAEACDELIAKTADRKSVLVFASGVDHAQEVVSMLEFLSPLSKVAMIEGGTAAYIRSNILADFKAGRVKYLVNVDVLTTGFDAPNVDAVALLRPTLSPGLYYQMVGRGLRIAPGKTDCLILDFAGNIERHGPIDAIEVSPKKGGSGKGGDPVGKHCPECREVVHASVRACTYCGHEFPPPEPKHETEASEEAVLSEPDELYKVLSIEYTIHEKRDAEPGDPRTLRVDYTVDGRRWPVSEWVCVEHGGYGFEKALTWWNKRTDGTPCPTRCDEAVSLARDGILLEPREIAVDESGKFARINRYIDMKFPEAPQPSEEKEDDFPF